MTARTSEQQQAQTAAEWLALSSEGELSSRDKRLFADWLRESPLHVREFTEMTLLGDELGKLPLGREQLDGWIEAARVAAASPAVLDAAKRNNAGTPRAGFKVRDVLVGLAAVLALAVMVGVYQHWQQGRYVTARGEQKIIALPDGSVVTLNTSSALKVDFSTEHRTLRLIRGEAYFRVAHDASRPFEVTAERSRVRAVGTQFNVRIADSSTMISVVEGTVEVRPDDDAATRNHAQRVNKGEQARVEPAARGESDYKLTTQAVSAAKAVAWTNGRVVFENTALIDVLAEFQRYRELQVSVAQPLRQLKLTGSFAAQDPESALAYIDTLPGVAVEQTAAHTFIIRQR